MFSDFNGQKILRRKNVVAMIVMASFAGIALGLLALNILPATYKISKIQDDIKSLQKLSKNHQLQIELHSKTHESRRVQLSQKKFQEIELGLDKVSFLKKRKRAIRGSYLFYRYAKKHQLDEFVIKARSINTYIKTIRHNRIANISQHLDFLQNEISYLRKSSKNLGIDQKLKEQLNSKINHLEKSFFGLNEIETLKNQLSSSKVAYLAYIRQAVGQLRLMEKQYRSSREVSYKSLLLSLFAMFLVFAFKREKLIPYESKNQNTFDTTDMVFQIEDYHSLGKIMGSALNSLSYLFQRYQIQVVFDPENDIDILADTTVIEKGIENYLRSLIAICVESGAKVRTLKINLEKTANGGIFSTQILGVRIQESSLKSLVMEKVGQDISVAEGLSRVENLLSSVNAQIELKNVDGLHEGKTYVDLSLNREQRIPRYKSSREAELNL